MRRIFSLIVIIVLGLQSVGIAQIEILPDKITVRYPIIKAGTGDTINPVAYTNIIQPDTFIYKGEV